MYTHTNTTTVINCKQTQTTVKSQLSISFYMNFLAQPSIKWDTGYGIYFLPGPWLTHQPQRINAPMATTRLHSLSNTGTCVCVKEEYPAVRPSTHQLRVRPINHYILMCEKCCQLPCIWWTIILTSCICWSHICLINADIFQALRVIFLPFLHYRFFIISIIIIHLWWVICLYVEGLIKMTVLQLHLHLINTFLTMAYTRSCTGIRLTDWPVSCPCSVREGPPWERTDSSEPDDNEFLMSMLNGLTMSRVHMNTHRVTRIRSGSPVNAGGLDTHSDNNRQTFRLLMLYHSTLPCSQHIRGVT